MDGKEVEDDDDDDEDENNDDEEDKDADGKPITTRTISVTTTMHAGVDDDLDLSVFRTNWCIFTNTITIANMNAI